MAKRTMKAFLQAARNKNISAKELQNLVTEFEKATGSKRINQPGSKRFGEYEHGPLHFEDKKPFYEAIYQNVAFPMLLLESPELASFLRPYFAVYL